MTTTVPQLRSALRGKSPSLAYERALWDAGKEIVVGMDEVGRGAISGGMIPKVRSCIDAVAAGAASAHLLDGRVPHVLLLELFTDAGIGTMITPDADQPADPDPSENGHHDDRPADD